MAKKMNPMDLIAAAAKKTPAKKGKKTTPTVDVEDEAVVKALDDWLKHKAAEKTAKANREMAEAILLPVCKQARREHIQATGSHTSAVKINGVVTMKTSKSYSKIPTENEEELETVFGEEEYERLFHTHTDIVLNERAASDPKVLQKLIDAVGADKFGQIFEVTQYIKPNDVLITERDLNPKVAKKHDKAVEAGLVAPYKPSFVQ